MSLRLISNSVCSRPWLPDQCQGRAGAIGVIAPARDIAIIILYLEEPDYKLFVIFRR